MLQASNEQWALTTRRTGLRVWGDQSILIVLNQRCTRAALTIFVSIASFESTSLSKPMGVSRAATGIGPITRATPINALLLEYVAQPTPLDFLETIALIEQAGYIPGVISSDQRALAGVRRAAHAPRLPGDHRAHRAGRLYPRRCTLAAAKDAKRFT